MCRSEVEENTRSKNCGAKEPAIKEPVRSCKERKSAEPWKKPASATLRLEASDVARDRVGEER